MALAVRVIATASEGGTSARDFVVPFVCSLVLLGFGVAHYRGFATWLSTHSLLTRYTPSALAWIGAAGALMCVAVSTLSGDGVVRSAVGLVLGALAAAVGLVGLVGLFWLPRWARPRWMDDRREAGR